MEIELRRKVLGEVGKVVIGRERETSLLLASVLAKGHVLLEGAPGVSKTILAKTFAKCMGLEFKRVQFTPDMLPMDMLGGFVFNMKDREFDFRRGPVFTNLLLADEINRAPPKVQSALLESMQESQVTIEGHTELLPTPFMVIATQNPKEFQGVYPLPENQLDRFLMRIEMTYPNQATEADVIRRNLSELSTDVIQEVVSGDELRALIGRVQEVSVSKEIIDYLTTVALESRRESKLSLGASPRAMVHLTHCARAVAFLDGREYVTPDDIKEVAVNVLGHRVQLEESSVLLGGVTSPDQIIQDIFSRVKPPR